MEDGAKLKGTAVDRGQLSKCRGGRGLTPSAFYFFRKSGSKTGDTHTHTRSGSCRRRRPRTGHPFRGSFPRGGSSHGRCTTSRADALHEVRRILSKSEVIPRGLLPANVPSWACASGGGTTPVGGNDDAETCDEPRDGAEPAVGFCARVLPAAVPVSIFGAAGAPTIRVRPMWRGRRALEALCDVGARGKRLHRRVRDVTQSAKVHFGLTTFIPRPAWARTHFGPAKLIPHASSFASSAGAHMACDEAGSAGVDRPAGARMGRDGAGVAGAIFDVREPRTVFNSHLFCFLSVLISVFGVVFHWVSVNFPEYLPGYDAMTEHSCVAFDYRITFLRSVNLGSIFIILFLMFALRYIS
jgi:hypothetical protein